MYISEIAANLVFDYNNLGNNVEDPEYYFALAISDTEEDGLVDRNDVGELYYNNAQAFSVTEEEGPGVAHITNVDEEAEHP